MADLSPPPARALAARLGARALGFYAVLDRDDPALAETLVGEGGARILQVRLKPGAAAAVLAAARRAREITRRYGALLVINDRVDLALAVEADGVHLGQDDLPLADAQRLVRAAGAALLIGISTHDAAQARAARAGGADYLGFGPVFPTTTKQDPDPVQGLDGLRQAVAAAGDVPVVAIGGVTAEHAAAIAATGAAGACAISAVNGAVDPAAVARRLGAAWPDVGGAGRRGGGAAEHDRPPRPARG